MIEDDDNIKEPVLEPNQKKLTDWEKEPKIEDLKQNLEDTIPDTKLHLSSVDKWLELLRAPSPVPESKKGKPRSRVQPKLVRKNAEWRYANLSEPFLSTPNVYRIKPVTFDDTAAAKQNELLLNYQLKQQMNFTSFMDRSIRDFVDVGTLLWKVSWIHKAETVIEEKPVYEYYPVQSEEEAQALMEQYQQMQQTQVEHPDSYSKLDDEVKAGYEYTMEVQDGMYYQAVIVEYEEVEEEKVLVNRPHVEVCDYDSVYIDPTCKGVLEDAKFIIHKFNVSVGDLKDDPRYKNIDQINSRVEDSLLDSDEEFEKGHNTNFKFNDTPRKKVTVYEYWGYWDYNNDGIAEPIVAAWVGNVLIRLEENPYPDKKHPFVIAQYMPKRNSVYGEPDAELIGDNQAILGAVTRAGVDILGRTATGQTGYSKDWLDPVNKQRFVNGEDYEYNPTAHPTNAIYQHTLPNMPNTIQYMVQSQSLDAEAITGVKAFGIHGISGDGMGDTAKAAQIVTDAAGQRTSGVLRRLVQAFVDLGRKFIALNAVYLSEEEIVRVTNEQFETVRRDDLSGSVDITISIATAEADAARASDLGFILQTAAASLPFELTKGILAEICRLKQMPDFAEQIGSFQPQPDPLAEAERQAEIDLKVAQAELIRAQAQEAMAKAQLNGAKIGETVAKTGKVEQEAEAKEYDNYEAQTGVKHAKEIDKASVNQQAAVATQQAKNENSLVLEQIKQEGQMKRDVVNAGFNMLGGQNGQSR